MKNIRLSLIVFFISLSAAAQQQQYKPTYQQLKAYEGYYQFINHGTLQMAASPRDTILYAIISQARYPLKATSNDVFMDNFKQPVKFMRDASNQVIGYNYQGETLKLLSKNVHFEKKMWYPRLPDAANSYPWHYREPTDLHDGLPIGNMAESGLDTGLLHTMMTKVIAGDYPNVHSVLIVKGGKLVFEEYFYEYTRDSLQAQRSASKSVVSALTGIAIHKGLNKSVNDRMLSYFPGYTPANNSELKQKITIGDLLSNQSGVSYDEAYDKAAGNETAMDYSEDWIKYTFDLPLIDTPGTVGRYNSGNPITLGRIIEIASHMPIRDFAVKNLFGPMGITNFKWRFKPDKTESEDYCQLYLRPRDMAKFGLLYYDNGVWNKQQLIPAEWVKTSTSKHSTVQNVDYGYLWWLKYLDSGGTRFYGFAAQGNGGQKTYVFRDQGLVIVITGGNYNTQSPSDELIKKYILPPFSKKN